MMAAPQKARKMDEERRATLAMQRCHQKVLAALPAMVSIQKWLVNDTAGARFELLKVDARKVMDALDEVALEGAPFTSQKPEGGT